jgi:ADP-heptose:LPS heptosyltransferase
MDMAYEITPQQLHLKSYYEHCGITDGVIRNPKLTLPFDHKQPTAKLFKKYAILHLDKRPQSGRNAYHGIKWNEVVWYLQNEGYDVIQIGKGDRQVVKEATQMYNIGDFLLMLLIGAADLFIGIDSSPSNIAIAMDTKAIILFGSVNPSYIIPDETNVISISNHRTKDYVCKSPYCWSSVKGTEGVECVEINGRKAIQVQPFQGIECLEVSKEEIPPCTIFDTSEILDAIDILTQNQTKCD